MPATTTETFEKTAAQPLATVGDADTQDFLGSFFKVTGQEAPEGESDAKLKPVEAKVSTPAKVEAKPAPAKAPEAKPDAAKPADDDYPEEIRSEKAREGWREVKRARDDFKKEAESAKGRVAELEAEIAKRSVPQIPDDVRARLAELEQERNELDEQLKITAIERNPRFKKTYDVPIQAGVDAARKIVGDEFADKAERIVRTADEATRVDLIESLADEAGLSTTRTANLTSIAARVSPLVSERASELARSNERIQQLAQISEVEKAQTIQQKTALADRLLAASKDLEAFQSGDNSDTTRMGEIENYKMFVRAAVTGQLSEDDARFLPLAAVQGLHFKTKVVPALQSRIEELESQLAGYESAKPRSGSSAQGNGLDSEKSFMSVLTGNA